MRKTWTITVDVQDNPYTDWEENADEMDYWSSLVERHITSVVREYEQMVEAAQYRSSYGPIDFTSVSYGVDSEE